MDITTVITYLKDLFATIMILIGMIFPTAGNVSTAYEPVNPDELVASIVAVSDIHVETNNPESYENLSKLLYGIKAGETVDAVVYTGDNVMNGQDLENFFFYTAVKAVKPSKNNFVIAGNHDLGNTEGDYNELLGNYLQNNKIFFNEDLGKGYFYRVVNGVYIISLISEDPTTWEFIMSEEQFGWLEGVLQEAQAADAPVLVFNHFPIFYNNATGTRLAGLLNEYGADLFVYGHYHNEMGADNFSQWNGVDIINLPRSTEITEYGAGDGIVIEVYEDEIIVRARNFITGEWLEDLVYTYDL